MKRSLTDRQKQILHLRSLGLTAKEVARELHISPDTVVKTQVRVAEKLDLNTSRLLVVLHAVRAAALSMLLCFSVDTQQYKSRSPVRRSTRSIRTGLVQTASYSVNLQYVTV